MEDFYDSLGGLVGYQLQCLQLLADGGSPHGAGSSSMDSSSSSSGSSLECSTDDAWPAAALGHGPSSSSSSAGGSETEFLVPAGLDLASPTQQREAAAAVAAGIAALPALAEVYPLGGAGDRLGLQCEQTGESLPTAVLQYCGRSLLENLLRDLQASSRLGGLCAFHAVLVGGWGEPGSGRLAALASAGEASAAACGGGCAPAWLPRPAANCPLPCPWRASTCTAGCAALPPCPCHLCPSRPPRPPLPRRQAREYLYWKLHGAQHTTPVAIMTSAAKGNHWRVEQLFERADWFGRWAAGGAEAAAAAEAAASGEAAGAAAGDLWRDPAPCTRDPGRCSGSRLPSAAQPGKSLMPSPVPRTPPVAQGRLQLPPVSAAAGPHGVRRRRPLAAAQAAAGAWALGGALGPAGGQAAAACAHGCARA